MGQPGTVAHSVAEAAEIARAMRARKLTPRVVVSFAEGIHWQDRDGRVHRLGPDPTSETRIEVFAVGAGL